MTAIALDHDFVPMRSRAKPSKAAIAPRPTFEHSGLARLASTFADLRDDRMLADAGQDPGPRRGLERWLDAFVRQQI